MSVSYPRALVALQTIFDGFGSQDSAETVVYALPQSFSVVKNGAHQADTFEVVLDLKNMPILPAMIRNCAVEIYLTDDGNTDPITARNQAEAIRHTAGRRPQIVGLVKDVDDSLTDGGSTFSVTGGDYTDLFLAPTWPDKRAPSGDRIDRIIKKIIQRVDKTGRVNLRVEPSDLSLPIVGAKGKKSTARGMTLPANAKAWDVIYNLATTHGLSAVFDGLDIVLTESRQLDLEREKDQIARLTWGKNLLSLDIRRTLGWQKAPQIKVVGFDGGKRSEAVFPKNARTPVKGVGSDFSQTKVVPCHYSANPDVLARLAQAYYYQTARSEQVINFVTRDMKDPGGVSLADLRAGDAVWLDFGAYTDEFMAMGQSERISYLLQRDYPGKVAQTIAAYADIMRDRQLPYRVQSITVSYDRDSGVEISGELQSMIFVPKEMQ